MIDPNLRKLLDELPNTSHGQALRVWLEEELMKIDSVDDAKSWDEVLGKQIAKKIIKDVFGFYKELKPVSRKINYQ